MFILVEIKVVRHFCTLVFWCVKMTECMVPHYRHKV